MLAFSSANVTFGELRSETAIFGLLSCLRHSSVGKQMVNVPSFVVRLDSAKVGSFSYPVLLSF